VRLALALVLLGSGAAAEPARPLAAAYAEPTDRYLHGILGELPPWGAMDVDLAEGARVARVRIELPQTLVFEDVGPRLWDLTGDGIPEVVVVESHLARGSRLAIWAAVAGGSVVGKGGPALERVTATPFIGIRFRWLAPLGAADLDGDGRIEVAWVETPHRARILRVARLEGNVLIEVAHLAGVTNHAIGEEAIGGGLRACPGRPPEVVALSADRSIVLAIRLEGQALVPETLGPAGPGALDDALACEG
jgi:hypothetical protein